MKKLIRNIFLLSIILVFFGINAFPQCNAPTLQPTNLILTSTTNSVSGIFNAAMDADHYLIVRSTMSTLNSTPVNGTTYAAFNSLGGGTVAAYQTDTIISDTNLYAGTQYFYFVFAATSLSCSGGPAYLITSPLIGTITCPLKSLNITAILQEYYNTSTDLMNQTLGINWDTGDLFHNFGSTIVDTVTVFIRSTRYPNYVIEATYNGLNLNTNGSIQTIYLNSNWNACPYGAITGYHHIVIKHRNSIETWSDSVDFSGQQINYNFFTHTPVEFAGGMYEDGNGNFEIWGGDVNQNGNLESEDCTLIYVAANSDDETVNNGYVICDIDGNGNIDTQDYGLAYNNANSGANTINFLVYPTQPSGLTLTPNYSTVTGTFTASETADHYLIVRSTNSTLSALPVKGTTYTAGNTIGGGIVVAYQKGTSFTDTSLNSGTHYYYIFASDTLYCTHSYLTAAPLTGNVFINCGIPLAQPTALTLSNNGNSISGSFTASASADHYLIVRCTIDPLTANPVNGTTYNVGNSLGGGTVVAFQTATTFTDNIVNPGIQYYYNVFAANCTGSPQYLTTNPLKATNGYNCESAITIYPTDTVKFIQIPITDTTYWVKFVATDTSIYLCMQIFLSDTSYVNQMTLYNAPDNCNAYTQITTNNGIYLHYGNLSIGNTYLLKIKNNGENLIWNGLSYYTGSAKHTTDGSLNSDLLHNLPQTVCLGTVVLFDPPLDPSFPHALGANTAHFIAVNYPPYELGVIFDCAYPTYSIYITTINFIDPNSTTTYTGYVTLEPEFTATSQDCNTTITFNGSTCITGTNYLDHCTYQYDYGDGANSGLISSLTSTHTYAIPGTYIVTFCINYTGYSLACSRHQCITKTITIYPDATVQFNPTSPQTLLCSGNTLAITASVPGVNIQTWSWSSVPAAPIGITYPNTPNITVSPTVSTTYTVVATDELNCTHTADFVVNVTPTIPVTITGSLAGCPPSTGTFSVSPITGITFTWTVPNGASIISGQGTNSINVDWGTALNGTITVSGTNGNYCYQGTIDPSNCVTPYYTLNSPTSTNQILNVLPHTGTVVTTNENVIFTGTSTINQNLTFKDCPNLMFGPDARINVATGVTLTFDNCTLSQACTCPWDGIYAEFSNSEIVMQNLCEVKDAKNAIVSNNGGNFNIENSYFVNNLISIWAHDYNPPYGFGGALPPPHPGYLNDCIFGQYPEYSGYYSTTNFHLTGIKVDNVYNLTIGEPGDEYSNSFAHLQFGIKTNNSLVNIYNNHFSDINSITYGASYTGGEPNEAAIFCKSLQADNPSYPLKSKVTIGGYNGVYGNSTGDYDNNIESCNIGIYGYKNQMDIVGNQFYEIAYNSIYLKDFLSDQYNSTVIKNNHTYNRYDPGLPIGLTNEQEIYTDESDANYYIIANQSMGTNVNLDISENVLGDFNGSLNHSGILLNNCKGSSDGSTNICNIYFNQMIAFQIPPTLANKYYGIKADNCDYAKITNNMIHSYSYATTSNYENLIGIYLDQTTNTAISENYMKNSGTGIYVTGGIALGTQFNCNDFNNCWNGIYFNNPSISDQLTSTYNPTNQTSDNYWYDIPTVDATSALRRVSGTVNTLGTIWVHRVSTNDDYNNKFCPYLTTGNSLFDNGSIIPYTGGTANCSNIAPESFLTKTMNTSDDTTAMEVNKFIANIINREQLMGKIVKSAATNKNLKDEHNYFAKEFVYKLIDKDPAYLNLGTNEDVVYQNFYTALNNSNSGKFNQINKYINARNFNAAQSLNTTLTATNTIENNRITVNNIYLNKVVNNQYLGESDSLTLVDLAYQLPSKGGDAVFTARVILGIDPLVKDDYQIVLANNKDNNTVNPLTINVYPNPAKDRLYIVSNQVMEGMAAVEIYDMNGKLSYNTTINTAQKVETININNIKVGIYNLRITTINQTFSQKLVIIK